MVDDFDFRSWGLTNTARLARLRCPHCRHIGTFDELHNQQDVASGKACIAGIRRCPNPDCLGIIFVLFEAGTDTGIRRTFPAETIDFDSTDLPESVVASLDEAVRCLAAGCYRATAIMVRRTLEDVCHDKGATGADLKKRLAALGQKALIPQELLDGLDALRLLGNDAAHIEAQTYNEVGVDEVTLGLEVCRELLKAVYQYGSIVGRLAALKATRDATQT